MHNNVLHYDVFYTNIQMVVLHYYHYRRRFKKEDVLPPNQNIYEAVAKYDHHSALKVSPREIQFKTLPRLLPGNERV